MTIFLRVKNALIGAAEYIGKAFIDVEKFTIGFHTILEQEKAVEPGLAEATKQIVKDALAFAKVAETAVSHRGLNWAEDIASLSAAEALIKDIPEFVAELAKGIKALQIQNTDNSVIIKGDV